jgi:hypothetical protein
MKAYWGHWVEVSSQLHVPTLYLQGKSWIGSSGGKKIRCLCRESNPGRPASSLLLYRLSYPGSQSRNNLTEENETLHVCKLWNTDAGRRVGLRLQVNGELLIYRGMRSFLRVNHPVLAEHTDKRNAVFPRFITRLNELDFICKGHMLDHYPLSGASRCFSTRS